MGILICLSPMDQPLLCALGAVVLVKGLEAFMRSCFANCSPDKSSQDVHTTEITELMGDVNRCRSTLTGKPSADINVCIVGWVWMIMLVFSLFVVSHSFIPKETWVD